MGASTTLYESIMGMIRRAYAGVRVQNDTKPVLSAPAAEGALALTFWPALRTQLLMKLHETGRGATEGDRRKRLAWALDACVKVGTVGDRYIIELGEGLREALEPQKRKAPASAAPASKRARGGAGRARGRCAGGDEDDGDAPRARGTTRARGRDARKIGRGCGSAGRGGRTHA